MLPVWDDQVHNWHTPYFTRLFLAANILIFFYQTSLSPTGLEAFYYTYWSVPAEIMAWNQWYTLLTNMFLHGGWMHLIWNMFFLYVFGDNIEATLWNFKFLLFYVAWWLAASWWHILLNMSSSVPAIGASWAIAAILWAYLIMFPKANIKLINTQTMRATLVPAKLFLWWWIAMQFTQWIGDLATMWASWWVARWAHIGGFVFWRLFWMKKWKYWGEMKLQNTWKKTS